VTPQFDRTLTGSWADPNFGRQGSRRINTRQRRQTAAHSARVSRCRLHSPAPNRNDVLPASQLSNRHPPSRPPTSRPNRPRKPSPGQPQVTQGASWADANSARQAGPPTPAVWASQARQAVAATNPLQRSGQAGHAAGPASDRGRPTRLQRSGQRGMQAIAAGGRGGPPEPIQLGLRIGPACKPSRSRPVWPSLCGQQGRLRPIQSTWTSPTQQPSRPRSALAGRPSPHNTPAQPM